MNRLSFPYFTFKFECIRSAKKAIKVNPGPTTVEVGNALQLQVVAPIQHAIH